MTIIIDRNPSTIRHGIVNTIPDHCAICPRSSQSLSTFRWDHYPRALESLSIINRNDQSGSEGAGPVRLGLRQSIPLRSIDSCAALNETVPCVARSQKNFASFKRFVKQAPPVLG